jgi:hypothetical protein
LCNQSRAITISFRKRRKIWSTWFGLAQIN